MAFLCSTFASKGLNNGKKVNGIDNNYDSKKCFDEDPISLDHTSVPLFKEKATDYAALKQSHSMENTTSVWLKLKVVLWKNFIIRKHHWFLTLCEIAIPIVLFVIIAYGRSKIDGMGKERVETPTYVAEHSSDEYYHQRFNHETLIFYTPDTDFTGELIRQVQLKFQLNIEAIKSFGTEGDLVSYYAANARNETVMGVVFKNVPKSGSPKQLEYVIRPYEKHVNYETHMLFKDPFAPYAPDSGSSSYVAHGFIAMKMALDTSFIEMASNKELPVALTMQEFPYPPYLADATATDVFLYVLPLITIFSFVFLCPAVLKRVVEEKSTGIKELMKMMGLQSWMLWLGWFLHAFVVNFLSIIVITFFMKVKMWGAQYPPIEYCSWSLFLVFLVLYSAAGINFCFAISTLFNRPTLAMVVGIFAWILSHSIPTALVEHYPGLGWSKIWFALFPNMALAFGYQAIAVYESREVGAHWGNLFKSASGGTTDISMGNIFVMLIVDIVLYMLIALYIENVKPGPHGLAKPYHFPISNLYNKIMRKTSRRVDDDDEEDSISKEYIKIESAPNMKPGIEIKNLFKKFGKQAAVNGLSIDIYEGQITALLGHNGAGKTTTMSIMTGMIGATSGKVLIKGDDIRYNLNKVRTSMGLCPQHNLQFTDLTVLEHLIFFAMLKGLSKAKAMEEADQLLKRLNLYIKRNSLASSLSGGMRRKLSLGIALIGDSKVLILDEPTSGLDPEARREIWDMLLSLRGSRTIVITTHFMEEADVLGDRIAIMDHGRLICYGTSMFLKSEYGTGYHLTLIRDAEKFKSQHHNMNQTDEITRVIHNKIKSAVLQANTANHLTYLLPHETKPYFYQLLADLENKKEALCIMNISMSVTTLEEVFLRVGNMVTKEDKQGQDNLRRLGRPDSINSTSTVKSTTSTNSIVSVKSTGGKRTRLQLSSLFWKRLNVTWKKKLNVALHILVALLITLLTLYLGEGATNPGTEDFTKFELDLRKYGETSVFYGGDGFSEDLHKMRREYDNIIAAQRGTPKNVSSVSDALIKKGTENIAFYKQHIVVSAEFNISSSGKKSANAMYSNSAMHGAPISLNLLMNAILKGIMGDGYSISCANAPLPVAAGSSSDGPSEVQVGILWLMWFPLGMLFLASTFLVFPQMERVSNIKQLQLMCGVKSGFYWLMCYVFDLIVYFGAVGLIILLVALYGLFFSDVFSGGKELFALFAILSVYGISIIPYSYLFSYKKTVGGGVASFLISSMFVSLVLTVVIYVMELSGEEYYENLGKNLKFFLLLFPQFGLTYTSLQFSSKAVWNYNWDNKPEAYRMARCQYEPNPCCDGLESPRCIKYRSYFHGDKSISTNLLEMAASVTIYFAILLLLETNYVHKIWDRLLVLVYNKMHPKKDVPDGKIDNKMDVDVESKRVGDTLEREKTKRASQLINQRDSGGAGEENHLNSFSNEKDDDLLLVHKLEKIYWGQKVVKGVSFGVKPGDCFGLLGVNGAGKTTTFRMLTGDEPLIKGDARILASTKDTVHISKDSKKYLEKVGYCPQFDAINEVLTGREILRLFAQLRGVSEGVEGEVQHWLDALGLTEYADKPCGEYSGGNKRKLSMAVALIASPMLVMLDEPTSGVDPVSRRKLWDTLTAIQRQDIKPSILLTSHSMEECEALCNKLAIMKAGQLECYGTIPTLKQKYGQGFTVMLKLQPPALTITVESMTPEDNQSTISQSRPLSMPQNEPCSKKKGQVQQQIPQDLPEIKQLMRDFEEQYKGVCTLRDKHSGLLHYHISDKNKRWSELFEEIEDLKQTHPIIEDYNISETTLEEVFLSIARSED